MSVFWRSYSQKRGCVFASVVLLFESTQLDMAKVKTMNLPLSSEEIQTTANRILISQQVTEPSKKLELSKHLD